MKINTGIVVVVIALILVAGMVAIAFGQLFKLQPTPTLDVSKISWQTYSNQVPYFSFEYPAKNWIVNPKMAKTSNDHDWQSLSIKETRYRMGMGNGWVILHIYKNADMTDMAVYGKLMGKTTIDHHEAEVWENDETNQRYVVAKNESVTFVIQSRKSFSSKEKDVEGIYNHILGSLKID